MDGVSPPHLEQELHLSSPLAFRAVRATPTPGSLAKQRARVHTNPHLISQQLQPEINEKEKPCSSDCACLPACHVTSYYPYLSSYQTDISCKGFRLIVVLTRVALCISVRVSSHGSDSQTVSLEIRSILRIFKADVKPR